MVFEFYPSVAKWLKLKLRKFWGLILTFLEVAGENLVVGSLFASPSRIVLTFYNLALVKKIMKKNINVKKMMQC